MAAAFVPAALRSLIRPLLPASMPKPQCGGPRVSDRACLSARTHYRVAFRDPRLQAEEG